MNQKKLWMNDIFLNTFLWIKDDFKSNRIRFVIELLAWAISIGCSAVRFSTGALRNGA